MIINSKPFKGIDREYIILSSELKRALEIKGDIISIYLNQGRSPEDIKKGVSPDRDTWSITTEEICLSKANTEGDE